MKHRKEPFYNTKNPKASENSNASIRAHKYTKLPTLFMHLKLITTNNENPNKKHRSPENIKILKPLITKWKTDRNQTHLRVGGREPEAAGGESGGVVLAGGGEVVEGEIEVGRGRAMADSDDGEDLSVGLEVLPWGRWGPTDHVLEGEGSRVPWLVGEGALLVDGVEGADGGEVDAGVAGEHRDVVAEGGGRDGAADGDDGDADHGSAIHADVRFHWGSLRRWVIWRWRGFSPDWQGGGGDEILEMEKTEILRRG